MPSTSLEIDDRWVLAQRPPKPSADPWRPHAFFVEPERLANGAVEDVATLFLTNRECPFRCLMCDLWQYTTDTRVPDGAIPAQIEHALARLPAAQHVKLYNAGNFFDAQAIPPADHARIAELMTPFRTVIVECHPLLVGERCLAFRDRLRKSLAPGMRTVGVAGSSICNLQIAICKLQSSKHPSPPIPLPQGVRGASEPASNRLQVAIGLETVHPEALRRLNKRMTLADFERAARFLNANDIAVRAFILLRPPFLDEAEGGEWAMRSLDFAFGVGVECCSIVPTRGGNGAMERLAEAGHFAPPRLESLEHVVEYGIGLRRGRVFADLWDVEKFYPCPRCGPARAARLLAMNRTQTIPPAVACDCRGSA